MKSLLFFLFVLFLFPAVTLKAGVLDSLISGKKYTFRTDNTQYDAEYLSSDSLFYRIKREGKILKVLKSDVLMYKEKIPEAYERINSTDTIKFVSVETKDGNDVSGQIISRDTISIVLKTGSGVIMTIPLSQIESITESNIEIVDGEYTIKDPNSARLFFTPTARPIKNGSAILSVTELFFPMVGIGITDYGTLVGGISLIPFSNSQLYYINAKITPYQSPELNFAGGFIYMNATSNNSNGVSIPYIVTTAGNKYFSFTGGAGLSFTGSNENEVMLLAGGEIQTSNKSKLILENWIFTGRKSSEHNFSFAGFRVYGNKLSADFALFYIWGTKSSGWPLLPFVSITYNIDVFQKSK